MPTDDKAAVLAANKAWYAALNAMFDGDAAPFAEIYSHADDVSYMAAEGGLRIGWDATWRDWQAQAKLAKGGHMDIVDEHAIVHGDMAVTQTVTQGVVNDPSGTPVKQQVRETSVYRREGGEWKVIAHHVDALPSWKAVAGEARDA